MPLKRRPNKRGSAKRKLEAVEKKANFKLRKSDRIAPKKERNPTLSKSTAAARKSVALINALKTESKTIKEDLKNEIIIRNISSNLDTPNEDTVRDVDLSMDIVLHIEIERVELTEFVEKSTKLSRPQPICEEITPDCLPITPLTPQSPQPNSQMTTSLPSMLSRYLPHDELLYFEQDPAVLSYFRERELQNRPKANYLQQQPQIDRAARSFLINWLVLIAKERELDTETLYHAVSYLDRFLSEVVIQRCKLQIVGLACLHIAMKFEVSRPPPISKFATVGNTLLDVKQIIQMEEVILKALSFDLRLPTAYTFVSAFAVATKVPNLLKYLTMYICELTLLEAEPYLQFLPSQVAAAAYALARYILGYDIWSELLADVTTCRLESLKNIFLCLSKTHACATKILPKAIQIKYLEKEYNEVASVASVCVSESLFDYLVEYYYFSLGL